MPEEGEAPVQQEPVQDTPPAAPEEGTPVPPEPQGSEPEIDYQKRFEDLQPELTKAQQQNAEFRRLYEAAQEGHPEALELLGIEQPGQPTDDDENYIDPDEQRWAEFDQLKEHLSQRDEEQEQAQIYEQEAAHIDDALDSLESELGFELSQEDVDFIVDRAVTNRGEDGLPDVTAAGKAFLKSLESARDRYMEQRKNAPKAPVGSPGEENIDLRDDESRRRELARTMESEGSE